VRQTTSKERRVREGRGEIDRKERRERGEMDKIVRISPAWFVQCSEETVFHHQGV
jgi:hypothetical protein